MVLRSKMWLKSGMFPEPPFIGIWKNSKSERLLLMQNVPPPLTGSSEEQRQTAMAKYEIIAPYLQSMKTLTSMADETTRVFLLASHDGALRRFRVSDP